MKKYLPIFLVALFGAAFGTALSFWLAPKPEVTLSQPSLPVSLASAKNGQAVQLPGFTAAAASATPAVVHIKTTISAKNSSSPEADAFRDFFGERGMEDFFGQQRPQSGSGSGVILTSDGYIITNNHVIEDADEVEVILNDKRSYNGRVIGTDPNTDLAVVKIEETKLPTIPLGNSDALQIGEWVLAVGNPFNLTSTVTAGIVSAKARNINILGRGTAIEAFIQTDAAVNPGNSGGALVNPSGELVGINSAIASQTGSFAGYSFAVPVNLMRKVFNDIVEFGAVQRGFIGVAFREIDAELSDKENLGGLDGVYVESFAENSAAEDAGIKVGDVITHIDDQIIRSGPELQQFVGLKKPGDKLKVSVNRDGKARDFTLTLRNAEGTTSLVKKDAVSKPVANIGATLSAPSKKELASLKLQGGVKVQELTSGVFKEVGIRQGFIITKIDKKPVSDVKVAKEMLNKRGESVMVEGYYPNGQKAYFAFEL